VSWGKLAAAAPDIAAAGKELLYQWPIGQGLLTTVRGDSPPRSHPVYVAIKDGRLLTFANKSAKLRDLEQDGRYALHSHYDPARPNEFMVRGRAVVIDGAERERIAADWYFKTDDTYLLVELLVEDALLGRRENDDEWPPRYSRWSASDR
jgi:hypothetical protein